MVRFALLIGLLLAGPAFAGCIGSDDANEPDENAAPATEDAMDDAMEDAAAQTAGTEVDVAEPIVTPVSQTITFTNGAWACEHTVAGQCQWLGPGAFESSFEPAFDGMLTGYDLTLTWEAATPIMEELNFGVYAYTEADGEHEVLMNEFVGGTSPLALSTSSGMLPPDASVWIWAWPQCEGSDTDHVCVMSDQDLNVEGTLTSMLQDAASGAEHEGHMG